MTLVYSIPGSPSHVMGQIIPRPQSPQEEPGKKQKKGNNDNNKNSRTNKTNNNNHHHKTNNHNNKTNNSNNNKTHHHQHNHNNSNKTHHHNNVNTYDMWTIRYKAIPEIRITNKYTLRDVAPILMRDFGGRIDLVGGDPLYTAPSSSSSLDDQVSGGDVAALTPPIRLGHTRIYYDRRNDQPTVNPEHGGNDHSKCPFFHWIKRIPPAPIYCRDGPHSTDR